MADPLQRYRDKRDFGVTPEPAGEAAKRADAGLSFVIQKHAARRLHYDFRLELDGVLLSWAVPKGPSFDPADKRMAVRTEDHPLSYGGFEGTIPPGQYGAGTVIVWDRGQWTPVNDPRAGLKEGKLVFDLHGEKLFGRWELVRIQKKGEKQEPWILFKKRDAAARPLAEYDVVSALPDSVVAKPLGPAEGRQAANDAPALDDAPRAELPETLSPQLAVLADSVPGGAQWVYEIKFDGYRVMARIDARGGVKLITRGGHDWTAKMGSLAAEVKRLGLKSSWLDGEIVVLDERGAPSFNRLQNAFDAARTDAIVYFLFDAPFLQGRDLRQLPLGARRQALQAVLEAAEASERVRFSQQFTAPLQSMLRSACEMGLEGVIAKRADAPYESRRSASWLKLKCSRRQEFVVGGFTERQNQPSEVGALMLGVHDDAGRLQYAGSVGTGWSAALARELRKKAAALAQPACPFAARPADVKGATWVKPVLVAEVSFGEWTPDSRVRHAVFKGLREDKPASAIVRERAVPPPVLRGGAVAGKGGKKAVGGVAVSNPERVVDASTGLTKLDLVRYYESVAEWILPHLAGRPVSLVRGPSGLAGDLFFQKHNDTLRIPGITELDPALWPGHAGLLSVDNVAALVGAAQMNVIEFHTWNAQARRIATPDRMVFDLDPGEGVAWPRVQEAAALTRTLLDELGLASWLKTSGGKGLHVVVPLAPKHDWPTVAGFSQAVVQHLARTIPDRFVAKSGAKNRVGKIFVDYLRNGHGATTAAAFSARARPGLGVSMPVDWDELRELKSGAQWTVATARERLSFQREDPWAGYRKSRQTLARAMKRLGWAP